MFVTGLTHAASLDSSVMKPVFKLTKRAPNGLKQKYRVVLFQIFSSLDSIEEWVLHLEEWFEREA
jgi:hypothetical protein